jgi:gliding motility-associated protein GldM
MVAVYTGNKNGEIDEEDFEMMGGTKMYVSRRNRDVATHLMVDAKDQSGYNRGEGLEQLIIDTRNAVLGLVSEGDVEMYLEEPIGQEAGPGVTAKSWREAYFAEMPLTAALTFLTKLESDVINTEEEVLNFLMADVSKKDYKFSSLTAKVIAKNSYVLTGQNYEADILLVAYDEKQTFPVEIAGSAIPVEGGMGRYSVRAGSPGPKKYEGHIKVLDPVTGEDTLYKFDAEYMVARPAAVVSPTKMNVFYIGVDNPVSISAAGMASSSLRASISGGGNSKITAAPGEGNYIVRVSAPTKIGQFAKVNVSASVDGSSMSMGTSDFRVKFIPDPIPTVGGIKLSSVPSNQFSAQRGVIPMLDNFDFDVRFLVTGFRVIYLKPRQDPKVSSVSGASFNPEMLGWVRNANPGDRFVIDNIKVKGPDGRVRTLTSATYAIR